MNSNLPFICKNTVRANPINSVAIRTKLNCQLKTKKRFETSCIHRTVCACRQKTGVTAGRNNIYGTLTWIRNLALTNDWIYVGIQEDDPNSRCYNDVSLIMLMQGQEWLRFILHVWLYGCDFSMLHSVRPSSAYLRRCRASRQPSGIS